MSEDLSAKVDAQARVIEALEARLAALEQGGSGPMPGAERDTRTNRRQLLGRAGVVAAGAVAGGAALVMADASPAAAAAGVFDGSPAVTANGGSGTGVFATSSSGTAVYASSQSGVGVSGSASGPGGVGISGFAGGSAGPNAFAVSAGSIGEGMGLYVESSAGITMRMNKTSLPVPVPSGSSQYIVEGCIVYNQEGLWFCYDNPSGLPQNAKWVRLDSGPIVLPAPKRVYDSRPGQSPAVNPKTPLAAATPRTINLKAASSGVPAGISAALLSVTATGTVTGVGGYLSVYRSDIGWPGTSNLNWSGPGQTVSVTTLSATDSQAKVNLYAGSQTDVVVDVLAYYR